MSCNPISGTRLKVCYKNKFRLWSVSGRTRKKGEECDWVRQSEVWNTWFWLGLVGTWMRKLYLACNAIPDPGVAVIWLDNQGRQHEREREHLDRLSPVDTVLLPPCQRCQESGPVYRFGSRGHYSNVGRTQPLSSQHAGVYLSNRISWPCLGPDMPGWARHPQCRVSRACPLQSPRWVRLMLHVCPTDNMPVSP